MQPRRWTSAALLGLTVLSLSACTTLSDTGVFQGRYPNQGRAPNTRPVYDRPANDARSTAEYRRIRQDAGRYANLLDRELRLNNRQENAIQRLLVDRTENLLRRTRARDHRHVYPFPRDQRLARDARTWWNATDRQIERTLNASQRRAYRYIASDLERYGRYDRSRHDDRYDRRDRDGDRDDRYRRGDRHDNGRGRGHDGRGRGRGHGG